MKKYEPTTWGKFLYFTVFTEKLIFTSLGVKKIKNKRPIFWLDDKNWSKKNLLKLVNWSK